MSAEKMCALVQKYSLDLAKSGIEARQISSNHKLNTCTKADFIGHARYLIAGLLEMNIEEHRLKAKEMLATVQNCMIHAGIYKFDEIQAQNRP